MSGTNHESSADCDIRLFLSYLIDMDISTNDNYFQEAKLEYIDTYNGGHIRELILFDEDYYLSQRGSRIHNEMTPIRDYFENGVKLRLSPHPIFDMGYIDSVIRSRNANSNIQLAPARGISGSPVNPFSFIFSDEGGLASPNMLFSPILYEKCVQEHQDLLGFQIARNDVGRVNPVVHYLKNWSTFSEKGVLRMSEYFDPDFYSMSAQRSSESIVDPMTHYFRSATRDRHDCNPKFHGGYYRHTYNIQKFDALSHFVRFGAKKGFAPNPYAFDELGIAPSNLPEDVMDELLLSYVRLK
ncbi:hypothetical protein [Methylobacterium aquaticum]|jgi:hypothetical protein|uniref:hypothetical protein n=1 Tax=Methylobacterium aquaticum TaxID=270351 RepID=UPI000AAC4AEF|nr:hypothetical protein [Methylobacterium aquaticum]